MGQVISDKQQKYHSKLIHFDDSLVEDSTTTVVNEDSANPVDAPKAVLEDLGRHNEAPAALGIVKDFFVRAEII